MVGMLGGLGSAAPANATPAAAAQPAAASSSSSLSCTDHVYAAWAGGFVVQVIIVNTGTTPVPFPPLTWTWPGTQQITAPVWGASITQSGETVTVTEPNGFVIPPGGSVTFYFTVRGTLPPVLPIPCSQV
jgi:hypothetical protein